MGGEEIALKTFQDGWTRELAHQALWAAGRALDAAGIPFWLSNGTLLGCVREGGLIAHDSDIDIGIMEDAADHEAVRQALLAAGFSPKHEFGRPGRGHEISFRVPGGETPFDVFFYQRQGKGCWMPLWVHGCLRRMVFPAIEAFEKRHFLGWPFNIPKNYEEILTAQYGEGWRVADERYHWSGSPRNLEPMNAAYWQEFYAQPRNMEPSAFARWARIEGKQVIDFGCGNGRDTYFLAERNHVRGVDRYAPEGPLFVRTSVEEFLAGKPTAEVAYCRFFFHSTDPETTQLVLGWARENNVAVYAEFRAMARSAHDHDRVSIDGQQFLLDLGKWGFSIRHYEEGHGLAVMGEDDPKIVRVVTY